MTTMDHGLPMIDHDEAPATRWERLAPVSAALEKAAPSARLVGLAAGAGAIVALAPPTGLAGPLIALLGTDAAGIAGILGIAIATALLVIGAAFATALTQADRRAIAVGYLAGVVVYMLIGLTAEPTPAAGGPWRDAWTYFGLGVGDPYAALYQQGGSGYPPPLLQFTGILSTIGWVPFVAICNLLAFLAVLAVAGPLAPFALLLPFVALEVWQGNVNLLIAAAIVWSFRWPALWSFVLVTKITPGIGAIWFAARGQWQKFGIALGATAVIVAVSFIVEPGYWSRWISAAQGSSTAGIPFFADIGIRVAIAAVIVIVGAKLDRPWLVPIACAIAFPVLWFAALAVLIAVIPLARPRTLVLSLPERARMFRRAVDHALGQA